jgi:RNA polymerase sigma factor (sigma-70 family)
MSETPASEHDVRGQNRTGLAVTDDAVSAWFIREILPLEKILMNYLQHNWRNPNDVPDLRQEVYSRVFEAARERIPDNPKRFLLTSARNLLIDIVRRKHVVPMETFGEVDALEVADGAPAPDLVVIEKDELRRIATALAQLPPRMRQAIELTYFEDLSCTEIARRMGIAVPVASKFIARGTLILGQILYGASANRSPKS